MFPEDFSRNDTNSLSAVRSKFDGSEDQSASAERLF